MVYIIGSLRNPTIPTIANRLRETGLEVFDDWYAAGPHADDHWRDYEKQRGHTYLEGLHGHAATNVFMFDKRHLDRCEAAVLVLPAGRSGHLELGYILGRGKPGYVLLEPESDRWDVMYQFATGIFTDVEELVNVLNAPASQFHQVSDTNSGVHFNIPALGISCACADCERGRRDRRGSGALTPEMIGAIS